MYHVYTLGSMVSMTDRHNICTSHLILYMLQMFTSEIKAKLSAEYLRYFGILIERCDKLELLFLNGTNRSASPTVAFKLALYM